MRTHGMKTWLLLPRDLSSTVGQRKRKLSKIWWSRRSRLTSDKQIPTTTGKKDFKKRVFFSISVYPRNYVKSLGKVTLAEIKKAAQNILPHFLSSESSQTVIVCPPSNLDDIVDSFKENGLTLTKINSLEETFLVD